MEALELMKQRHSVRQYKPRAIEPEKRAALNDLCSELNQKAGLSIQIVYDEPDCFDSFMAHYGKFSGVHNYIALIGKKSPKLEETLGRCGEQLVLKAQELGLNTCWVAMTHGKSRAVVGPGEKQVGLISLGYGETQGVAHKSKPMQALCRCAEPIPEWFKKGMTAAMLAPTAMARPGRSTLTEWTSITSHSPTTQTAREIASSHDGFSRPSRTEKSATNTG